MSEHLEILGPEHGHWEGWPAGALTMFAAVTDEQWNIWRDAGSPKPASHKLMGRIDAVMYAAFKTELGQLLNQTDPTLLASWQTVLREHQHYDGMLSTADLIPSL